MQTKAAVSAGALLLLVGSMAPGYAQERKEEGKAPQEQQHQQERPQEKAAPQAHPQPASRPAARPQPAYGGTDHAGVKPTEDDARGRASERSAAAYRAGAQRVHAVACQDVE